MILREIRKYSGCWLRGSHHLKSEPSRFQELVFKVRQLCGNYCLKRKHKPGFVCVLRCLHNNYKVGKPKPLLIKGFIIVFFGVDKIIDGSLNTKGEDSSLA